MSILRKFSCLLAVIFVLLTAGCATQPNGPPPGTEDDVTELARQIGALGADVDPQEAERAARIALSYTHQLAQEYQITDPPLIHNTKVNFGLRPRGLCWHWAEDMEKRLLGENFQTLDMHRAIANAGNPFRIEHSTAIVSQKGDTMFQGLVLDPWRYGGVLHWAPTREDTDYKWRPREEVLEEKRQRLLRERAAR